MAKCAYCNNEEALTREHIVPAYMYNFQKELEAKVIGWNEVAGKMVGGELKIKDVCAKCNGGVLSELDAYSKSMLINSGLFVQNYPSRKVELKYDYNLLLRWLLKVSFNSSRADGVHKHLFEKYIPYIIENKSSPKKNQIALIAQMAAPEIFDKSSFDKEVFYSLSEGADLLNPFQIRICYGWVQGASAYTLRMIIVGPIIFNLLMFDEGVLPGHAAVEVKRIFKMEPTSKLLTQNSRYALVKPGSKSWIDLYEHQIQRT